MNTPGSDPATAGTPPAASDGEPARSTGPGASDPATAGTGPADPDLAGTGPAGSGPAAGAGGWVEGVRLGVDVGTVRVGVAASDPAGILATPLATLARDPAGGADLAKLARLVAEREAVEVVVGLPRSLSGRHGPAARAATEYAALLAKRVHPVPVRLSDERLTTVAAERRLGEAGIRGRKGRSVVDRSAAVLILQGWLDGARRAR